jgi:copper chaperone NosL
LLAAEAPPVRQSIEKVNCLLDAPVDLGPRILLVLAFALLLPTYLAPLYNLTMFAPQYQDGLRLHIYSYRLEGGNGGQDIKEINLLNHYIGMKDLAAEDFTEFKWLPFVIGIFGLLFLRAAVMGKMTHLVDVLVLYVYFGAFALWSFAYKMYSYGHNLAPTAAVRVAPFTPPLFGFKKLANFEVYSYPAIGSYALAAVALCLVIAFALAWREAQRPAA